MSLSFSHPDQIARCYVEIGLLLGSTRALDPVVARGAICPHCKGGPMTWIAKRAHPRRGRDDFRRVCVECRREWEGTDVDVLRTELPPTPRAGASERWLLELIEDFRRVRPIIENRPLAMSQKRWDFNVMAWLAYLDKTIGTYANVEAWGKEHRPAFARLWTERRIRGGIARARAVARDRAERQGMLHRVAAA